MNYYDIEKIYDDMEQYLIDNIKRNLTSDLTSFHLKEEKEYGFDWEAWQSTKLRELKRYRNQNKNILKKRLNNIDKDVRDVLREEYSQGKKTAHKGFILALKKGFKSPVKVKDSFFKINDRKLDALIKSVNNDFKKANHAVLRMTNDTYRQIIFEASMYNNTGVMTGEAAIRKAIGNFEKRGINSITYSNGSRHRISEYTRMAIRTASTRAYLQGEGEFRKKIGETLVIMSKHGTACKLCQPFEGKVLIDDVYSGGSKKDGNYMLLSTAMKQGLYHPNCRHGHGTYYKELGKKESQNIAKKIEKEETAKRMTDIDKKTRKSNLNINYNEITNEWLEKATPNSHKVVDASYYYDGKTKYIVDGNDVTFDYGKEEKTIAEWLKNKLGGEIKYLPKINKPKGIQTSDYLFRGEYWDLKTITGNGKRTLEDAIKKKKNQAHNFIIDITNSEMTKEEAIKQIQKNYKNLEWLDKTILKKDEELIKIYKKRD